MQKEYFKLSHCRITCARNSIRTAVMSRIYPMYVRQASTIPSLTDNERMQWFEGVYGCIDGSHLPIEVGVAEKENRINGRNKFPSTNALLVCGVDDKLVFNYALFGAEGVGSDSIVFRHASTLNMTTVRGGNLLGDAGYALSHRILTPYRGVRYHLKEFSNSAIGRPRNREELFNLRHASLRNQVERSFGVMKKRFRIMREPLVMAHKSEMWATYYTCVAIHNFICTHNPNVDNAFESEYIRELYEENIERLTGLNKYDDIRCRGWRDNIAQQMWDDYAQRH
jgi:hypothetical protein